VLHGIFTVIGASQRGRHVAASTRIAQAKDSFLRTDMFGSMLIARWDWQKLFSYGEVVCFVSAWAIGILIALEGQRPNEDRTATRSFASTSDSLGIQALRQ
jgi:hypothetical protein